MTPAVEQWEESVGFLPHKVSVYEELARKGTLYLRWREGGNWRKLSLRRGVRGPRGRIDPEIKKWALQQAEAQYARLVAGVPLADRTPKVPLSIQKGFAAAIDPETGKYPTKTAHRGEVEREMKRAIEEWGANTSWESITKAHLRKLWRRRILQLRAEKEVGLRGAEVTVARVLAVAAWLRDEDLIPSSACVPSRKWKQELRADWIELTNERTLPTPARPRHTLEEMRKILAKAGEVDPRLELALALGAELRLGQVIRCRRTDLDLEHKTLTVSGKGGKRGTVVKLTAGQMRVATHAIKEGYLSLLEGAAADYPLFPGLWRGKGIAKARYATVDPIGRDIIDDWFHRAEVLAEVPKVAGRAAYGLRRAAVDAVKAAGISREGLQAHGGWADTQMPDKIYADQEADYARDEARDVRAKIRGEET